ncbi:TM6S2 protein, partial [Eudromia elegans]|nr:TM6S2 protein [Eudromia elegans]
MRLPAVPGALALSLLALPTAVGISSVAALADSPAVLVLVGALALAGLFSVVFVSGGSRLQDPLFCVFLLFSFTCAVDLLVALEEDGFISGVAELYVREGESYLRTAHGVLLCYWDGTVHYGLCLAVVTAMSRRRSYRSLGLFWLGSVMMSIVVFLLGNLIGAAVAGTRGRCRGLLRGAESGTSVGKYSPELSASFLLNVPYVMLPAWAGLRLLQQPRALPALTGDEVAEEQRKGLHRRPQDAVLVVLLLLAAVFTFFRGMVVLDCPADSCFEYIYQREPYLRDPVAYPKVQMLIYLFYVLPFLCLGIYGLLRPGCTWMLDWSLVVAGAMAQAQFSHVGSSLHGRTPFPYQTPEDARGAFLATNALYALAPQLLALRCLRRPAFFLPAAAGLARHKKHQ